MKSLILASAVVALVAGAADPQVWGYPYGYAGVYGFGKSAPCVNAANVPVPCAAGYSTYGYGLHHLGKREAEADAEADPALLYSGLGYPYAYGASAYAYGASPYAYAGYPHAVASTPYGLTHSSNVGLCTNYLGAAVPCGRKKREAEADAEADAALLYSSYGYPYAGYGYGYNTALNAVAPALSYAAHPALTYTTAAAPAVAVAAAAPVAVAAAPAVAYAAAPALAYHTAPAAVAYHAAPVVATNAALGHAVAATPFGYTHSSNVGICTNNLGEQVSC